MMVNPNYRYRLETWCARNNVHPSYLDLSYELPQIPNLQYHSDTTSIDAIESTSVPNPDYVSVDVVWIPKELLPGDLFESCGYWYNPETGTLLCQIYEKDLLEWLHNNLILACDNTAVYSTWAGLLRFLISVKRKP